MPNLGSLEKNNYKHTVKTAILHKIWWDQAMKTSKVGLLMFNNWFCWIFLQYCQFSSFLEWTLCSRLCLLIFEIFLKFSHFLHSVCGDNNFIIVPFHLWWIETMAKHKKIQIFYDGLWVLIWIKRREGFFWSFSDEFSGGIIFFWKMFLPSTFVCFF